MINNETDWLTINLKQKIKAVFEPRYQRMLTDEEVIQIAENLTGVMETFLKLRWRQTYANSAD